MDSTQNGTAATAPDLRAQLAAKRRSNRLIVESIREKKLKRLERIQGRREDLLEAMSFDWVTPYADLLDRFRREPEFTGPSSSFWRRNGKNYPIFQSEQELALLRAPARILCSTNSYAIGLLEGLTSYVVGPGYTYRAAKVKESDAPDDLQVAAQRVVDEFIERSEWYGGEQPGLEEELFWRSCEDGEFLLVHYVIDNGLTEVRTAEPEQLTAPPGGGTEWSFGIRTDPGDVQRPLGYWLYFGDSPADGEEFSPEEVTHYRKNVKRSIKRGMTDFSFDTLDALELASRLRTNLGDSAAQQAAIVGIRQHESGSKEDITAWTQSEADWTERDALTGKEMPTRRHKRGEWQDFGKGTSYIGGPIAQSQPIHLQVLQGVLRSAGQRWNAPEWLPSADSSNSNYASSLVGESPFVRRVVRAQRGYKSAFRRTMLVVLENFCRHRGLYASGRFWSWEEVRKHIDVIVEAPSPETRNKQTEAQTAQIEIPLGVDSRQRYAQSQGRDWDQIQADNEQYQLDHGSDGQQLPLPSVGAGGPPSPLAGLTESWFDDLVQRVRRDLLEDSSRPGASGVFTDAAGRRYKLQNGKRVPLDDEGGSGGDKGVGSETIDKLKQEVGDYADRPGVWERIKRAAGVAHSVAWHLAIKATELLGSAAPAVLDTPEDITNPYIYGIKSSAGTGTDPLSQATGLNPWLVAKIGSVIVGRIAKRIAGKRTTESLRGSVGFDVTKAADALISIHEAIAKALGHELPDVDRNGLLAALKERASRDLKESGKSGTFTDAAGRRYKLLDGKRVSLDDSGVAVSHDHRRDFADTAHSSVHESDAYSLLDPDKIADAFANGSSEVANAVDGIRDHFFDRLDAAANAAESAGSSERVGGAVAQAKKRVGILADAVKSTSTRYSQVAQEIDLLNERGEEEVPEPPEPPEMEEDEDVEPPEEVEIPDEPEEPNPDDYQTDEEYDSAVAGHEADHTKWMEVRAAAIAKDNAAQGRYNQAIQELHNRNAARQKDYDAATQAHARLASRIQSRNDEREKRLTELEEKATALRSEFETDSQDYFATIDAAERSVRNSVELWHRDVHRQIDADEEGGKEKK